MNVRSAPTDLSPTINTVEELRQAAEEARVRLELENGVLRAIEMMRELFEEHTGLSMSECLKEFTGISTPAVLYDDSCPDCGHETRRITREAFVCCNCGWSNVED